MNLPTREQCFQFFRDFHTPWHIIEHSLLVNKVAIWLGEKLMDAGKQINLDLIDRASLLADLLRLVDVKKIDQKLFSRKVAQEEKNIWQKQREEYAQLHHSQANYLVLKKEYPELAKILRKDYYAAILQEGLFTWEEKVIYYADKRVRHRQIVDLAIRLKESHKRWTEFRTNYSNLELNEFELEIDQAIKKIEEEIFRIINKKPEDIKEVMKMEVEGTERLLNFIIMKNV